MGAIRVMWIRQLKKYWRSKPRMIGSLAQPILFLVALGFGFGPMFEKAGGGSYITFLAPGIITMSILFTAMFTGIELIWDRQFGFLKETLVSPASRFNIFLGRTLGGATVATIQGIIVFLITLAIGFRPESIFLLPVALLIMFLIAFVFTAFGTAIATMLEDMQAFPLIINFLIMPTFFLSGALFPLAQASGTIRIIALVNPLSYGVDALRNLLTGIPHLSLFVDVSVLIVCAIVVSIAGSYFFSKMQA